MGDGGEMVEQLLRHVCDVLGMDVAFIARHVDGDRVFTYAAGPSASNVAVGARDPLEHTYCQRIVDGRIAGAVADALERPELAALELTGRLGIRAYIGVPLQVPDGQLYGTLCAFSSAPDERLDSSDLRLLQLVGAAVGSTLAEELEVDQRTRAARHWVEQALDGGDPSIVFQPIVELGTLRVVGYEALSRFAEPPEEPDRWFALARSVDLGADLELRAVAAALAAARALPGDAYISVNVSPYVVCDERFVTIVESGRHGRDVVVEFTEHDVVADLDGIRDSMRSLRSTGCRMAVDDAGAGWAGLTRIVELRPDIVKFDKALVQGCATDVVRNALLHAGVRFSDAVGVQLVAEGVETADDADALRALGVELAQGFHFGRPAHYPEVAAPDPEPAA